MRPRKQVRLAAMVCVVVLGCSEADATSGDLAATPRPDVVPAVVVPARPADPDPATLFVRTCGTLLCVGGSTFPVHAASVLSAGDHPEEVLDLAQRAQLNTVRVVSFLHEEAGVVRGPYDEERWARVDRTIALAGQRGLRVELDLTTYRNLLVQSRINPYAADWGRFVRFVALRRNTVSGRLYRDDPTIALVAFAAEVEPPGSTLVLPVRYSTADITGFYRRTMAQWRALDRNHVLTTGGFLHLNDGSGIDWRTIFALPVVDVPALHLYSDPDRTRTLPAAAALCAELGKPLFLEEFGYERGDGDASRAKNFQAQYVEHQRYGTAGVAFWNLGLEVTSPTYDVNPQTPLTWAVVRAHVPASVPYSQVLQSRAMTARLAAVPE